MDLHEYQAKEILSKYGVAVPPFAVASNQNQVEQILQDTGWDKAVVKVQVHAGGRGKAGGVKFARSTKEILKVADELIGLKIVNRQTGPAGVVANEVMIGSPLDIKKEYYVGVVMDRDNACPMLIASPEGGMDIEEIAEQSPEKILKLPIRLDGTLKSFQLMKVAKFMGWSGDTAKKGMKVVAGLAKAFVDTDASMLEINPLVEDMEGGIWALDAKLSVDDNALFRHPAIAECYDPSQRSPNEAEAKKHDLAYIALDGEIGCMVNGAGLAMATMDIINHFGSEPANFLDVGGSATEEKVEAGFKIILDDPNVKGILVNIFGGIMSCATIARGVLAAADSIGVKVPLVVRLEGTHVEEGKALLDQSSLKNIISASDLKDAAEKVVAAVRG